MWKALTGLTVVLLAACQPMYGAAPAKLRNPDPIKPPADLPVDVVKITYDEDCELVTTPVKHPRRDHKRSEGYVREADSKVAAAETSPEPRTKGDLFIDGIDTYGTALTTDPFSAEATLKLAVAYDKVRHKGCALAMLRRLQQLAENPTYAGDANGRIDEVLDHKKWFEGYRRDALEAIGR